MERQMAERVALYTRRTFPGEPLPINITPVPISDGVSIDLEVRDAAGELSNGRSGGALKMSAEHVKEWNTKGGGSKAERQPGCCEIILMWISLCVTTAFSQ
jgi:hypothetical protein